MPGIERYLGVRSAASPVYSPVTEHWYFLMNFTDTFQVFGIERPGAWPKMLTDYPERVSGIHAVPNRAALIFSRDRGGNEYHQFYWMDLTSMEVRPLTNDPGVVHLFGAVSPDGQKLAYTATGRNGRDYDVYVMSLDNPGKGQRVLSCEGHFEVRHWGEDGTLLLQEVRGNSEQSLHQLDLASGQVTRLTPAEPMAVYHDASRAPDGRIYALTDYERDFMGIRCKIASGDWQWIRTEEADIDHLALDPRGRHLAYTVNREGFSALHVVNLEDGDDRHVETFDESVVFDLAFDERGETLAVTRAGADHNMNIALVRIDSLMVEPLTDAPMTGLQAKNLIVPRVVRYESFDGRQIPTYVYRPSLSGDLPVVISVHGGPEAQERPYFSGWYQYLLAHGYAVVTPNVRGSTGYGKAYSHLDDRDKRMDSVRDIASLVDWIRNEPGLDGHRIAIYGGSYGGFMVLSSITQYPDLFQAAIDIVGMANLESFLENTSEWRRALREVEYGYLATDRAFLRAFSPIYAVDRIKAPLFVVHGVNDPRVPFNEAEQIVEALSAKDHPVEFRAYPDEGHGIAKMKNRLDLYPQMVDFLDRYLR